MVPAPLVAIVGSVDPGRAYEPPLTDAETARRACEEIGRELARAGCRIAVFSSRDRFIEASVVRGYVASGRARAGSIEVLHPRGADSATFAEAKTHREMFVSMPHPSTDWEVAFYQSLTRSQAILIVGGGRSSLIAGVVAMATGVPVVPLAAFGGAAARVWSWLGAGQSLATEADIHAMASDWGEGSAANLVAGLLRQHERKLSQRAEARRREAGRARWRTVSVASAGALVLLASAAIPLAQLPQIGLVGLIALLAYAPLLAGASGALIRTLGDGTRSRIEAAMLGLVAGFVSFVLYVASQVAATPDALKQDGARRLLLIVLPIGFVAGLTFDAVYSRLRTLEIADVSVLESGGASRPRR